MEPVEINAGTWYLRTHRAAQWASDTAYSWAVCHPTTGDVVAEIVLEPADATLQVRSRHGYADAAATAEQAVRRFAASALGLQELLPANHFRD